MKFPHRNELRLILVSALVAGCTHAPNVTSNVPHPVLQARAEVPADLTAEIARTDSHIEEKEGAGSTGEAKTEVTQHPKVLIELNASVQQWIEYFTQDRRDVFERFLARGAVYRGIVEKILQEEGIPKEFYYLAMIESGYSTAAVSHANAVGVWQFIRGTGDRYGLRIDSYADERRDPIRATRAAAKYLRDLYNVFGSWRLAMAAYNAGEYRILGAIMKGKTRDFWTLAEKNVLPRETMAYVPKFLAAVIIGENPGKFGFRHGSDDPAWDAEMVEVPAPVRLADIAQTAGVSLAELRRLNPHLRREMTPPGDGDYGLWLPKGNVAKVRDARSRLASLKVTVSRQYASRPPSQGSARTYHRVSRGETLSSIARRYGMTVASLKRINGMRSNRVLAGTKLRVARNGRKPAAVYRVKPGDTLTQISTRFGVPIRRIKRMNNLRSNVIYAGQPLRIQGSPM